MGTHPSGVPQIRGEKGTELLLLPFGNQAFLASACEKRVRFLRGAGGGKGIKKTAKDCLSRRERRDVNPVGCNTITKACRQEWGFLASGRGKKGGGGKNFVLL